VEDANEPDDEERCYRHRLSFLLAPLVCVLGVDRSALTVSVVDVAAAEAPRLHQILLRVAVRRERSRVASLVARPHHRLRVGVGQAYVVPGPRSADEAGDDLVALIFDGEADPGRPRLVAVELVLPLLELFAVLRDRRALGNICYSDDE